MSLRACLPNPNNTAPPATVAFVLVLPIPAGTYPRSGVPPRAFSFTSTPPVGLATGKQLQTQQPSAGRPLQSRAASARLTAIFSAQTTTAIATGRFFLFSSLFRRLLLAAVALPTRAGPANVCCSVVPPDRPTLCSPPALRHPVPLLRHGTGYVAVHPGRRRRAHATRRYSSLADLAHRRQSGHQRCLSRCSRRGQVEKHEAATVPRLNDIHPQRHDPAEHGPLGLRRHFQYVCRPMDGQRQAHELDGTNVHRGDDDRAGCHQHAVGKSRLLHGQLHVCAHASPPHVLPAAAPATAAPHGPPSVAQ